MLQMLPGYKTATWLLNNDDISAEGRYSSISCNSSSSHGTVFMKLQGKGRQSDLECELTKEVISCDFYYK